MLWTSLLLSALLAQGTPCTNNVPSGLVFCAELSTADTVASLTGLTASVLDRNSRQVASSMIGSTNCVSPFDAEDCPDSSLSTDQNCLSALKSFSCRWSTAPTRDWTLGLNCDDATLATPTVQQCNQVFTACGLTVVSLSDLSSSMDQATLCNANGPLDFVPPVLSNCVDIDILNDTATAVDYRHANAVDAASGVTSTAYIPDKDDDVFSTGSTVVTFSATDGAENKQDCMYMVTVGICSNNTECLNGGTCANNLCTCQDLWFGLYCENKKIFCPGDSTCQGKGECNYATGECQCVAPWGGLECDSVTCPTYDGKVCNDRGICHSVGVCQCDMGWIGAICQIQIEDSGMTGGQLAGAVIGGLLFSFFSMVMLFAYLARDESVF